ncbi:hypothetical protein [Segetibacter aerophilus]|uniref:hypothetical protein n=1 Tax=Segetibacter aerophilus TaxID=670293 RepID=UPI0011BDCD16|nr:hypothetical protein [Segetibacter aerophilus]
MDLYVLVRKEAELKFDRVLRLCKSEIQKKFIGYFYYFFLKNDFDLHLLSIEWKEFENTGDAYRPVYYLENDDGLAIRASNDAVQVINPFTGDFELLIGFTVKVGDVAYEIIPNYYLFNRTHSCSLEVGIIMKVPKTGNVLGRFAIIFNEKNTPASPKLTPEANILLNQNDFVTIEFSANEIDTISDKTIVELENAMYKVIFGKESEYYRFKSEEV